MFIPNGRRFGIYDITYILPTSKKEKKDTIFNKMTKRLINFALIINYIDRRLHNFIRILLEVRIFKRS